MKKSKSYDGSVHDKVVQGMANMLWWMAWADIVEDNNISLSGKQIEREAPPTPQKAFMLAERWLGHIECENKMSWSCMLAAAWDADRRANTAKIHGFSWDREVDYQGKYAERFGECLAFGVGGHGVSWEDDHASFTLGLDDKDFEIPLLDCGESQHELEDDALRSIGV